ncbi:MAG: XdhC family protein [Sandaracinaceae bacterium]
MTPTLLAELNRDRAAKRAAVLVTRLADGAQTLLHPREEERPGAVEEAVWAAARAALQEDRARTLGAEGAEVFVEPFNPPLRMILVGAVHIAQPLARMAQEVGFEVIVVDPRTRFASEARFGGIARRTGWPDDEIADLAPDARTAVVTLTHDPKLDDPALRATLRTAAFYVGALGSRKTQAARLRRLREAGFGPDDLARIHGPVGLDIGARSPAEIAAAVLAQVIQVLRVGS